MTRSSADGGAPITVSSRGGKSVTWARSEVKFVPLAFDATAVSATKGYVDRWAARDDRPATVRVCCHISGLPKDGLFLELDGAGSEVVWSDGSIGSVRETWTQGGGDDSWSLDVLTSVPPPVPDIRSIRIALDLHRSTLVARSKAEIAVDEAASFDFGSLRARWILSSDLQVTEFLTGTYGKPLVPYFDRGLYAGRLVRLADAGGNVLRCMSGGGAGSQTINHLAVVTPDWGPGNPSALVPPVHVTVDVPLETEKTRVSIQLKDIRPQR